MTSIERTAYPQFRRLISARVLHVFFIPAAEEIAWAQERTASCGVLRAPRPEPGAVLHRAADQADVGEDGPDATNPR